ncbi:flavin reductase family protein [Aureimonas psammosilenae]|uniref:flavin reductase family protein n=1 Tax=Aureimonas psammosilenae TaxID=2495496 RepID=UPI001260A024|nr:flavin reductase family protein [Aureimonas psammosilenae]
MTIEPKAFRDAMSRFASAVHIVTTDGKAGRRGVTATAVVGVSDDPATLLVCLNAASPQNHFFGENGNLGINVLAAETGQKVAQVFAGSSGDKASDRFANGEWGVGETGAPLLADALVAFDCRIVEARRVATHHVLLAEVVGLRLGPDAPPLLYHARGYRLL